MTVEKWLAPAALTSILTTELNGLTDGSYSSASVAVDNETGLYRFISFELTLPSLTPTGVPVANIFILYSMDNGSTFADGGGSVAPRNSSLIATLDTSTSTGAKKMIGGGYPILPLQFKVVLQNDLNVSLAGTLNTLKYRLHNRQVV